MAASTIQDFLLLFDGTQVISEWFKEVEIKSEATHFKVLNEQDFLEKLKFLNARDKMQLTIQVDEHDTIEYYSQVHDTAFFTTLAAQTESFQRIKYSVKIFKKQIQGRLSLYFYDEFIQYLETLTIEAQLHEFNSVCNDFLVFELQTNGLEVNTKRIFFVNKANSEIPATFEVEKIIENGISACSYNHAKDFKLIPEDFKFSHPPGNNLDTIFSKLRAICSIAFLFDISELAKSKLTYRLNGYKTIQSEIQMEHVALDPLDQYFNVYIWVYNSGNFNDKLGLARNIISLHMDDPTSISLNGNAFQSIKSSYKVYEKQNIKQYIEIRNKVTDQLLAFHDRANKIIETFATGFQKSALALITFYASVFLLKFLNKDDLVGIFTLEASILSTVFIACSVLYLIVSRWEVNAQRQRFIDNYNDLKSRYEDLLDIQDIERILNRDREFRADLAFMDAKRANYTWLWVGFLTIFFMSTWLLYMFAKANGMINMLLIFHLVFSR
ncbi:MAG: hypothetical protein EOO07_01025 [Chitinophagaceae bacterium]|nr:MAG: hypothetical protein EOO07_01025 [Chitinophagaceae bacterium]